jgi:DNA ligase (NAD+)
MNSSYEELESIEGVGPIVAKEVINFWSQKENQTMVKECIRQGVKIEKKEFVKDQFLTNKTFVFTGTLKTFNRRDGKEVINKYGGSTTNSISKKTDFLIAGVGAGSKLEKAKKLNIKILNEQEFLKFINLDPNKNP